jgi:hypothetical protein
MPWEIRDVSGIELPAIAEALRYWRSKCVEGRLPSRTHIDPLEMRQFLSKILLIDVNGDGGFTYRLCGSSIVDGNGKDLTGRQASAETLGESVDAFLDSYRRTVQSRQPVYFSGELWWQNREYVHFEQINLPLSTDGQSVDRLFCVIEFE